MTTRRAAFTLVELLVVICHHWHLSFTAIAGQYSCPRSSAARSMFESGQAVRLAFHLHHDQYKQFPTGGWDWIRHPFIKHNAFDWLTSESRFGFSNSAIHRSDQYLASWRRDSNRSNQSRLLLSVTSSAANRDLRRCLCASCNRNSLKHALCDYAGSNRDGTGAITRYFQPGAWRRHRRYHTIDLARREAIESTRAWHCPAR